MTTTKRTVAGLGALAAVLALGGIAHAQTIERFGALQTDGDVRVGIGACTETGSKKLCAQGAVEAKGTLRTDGSTILGNASADTLTLNAGSTSIPNAETVTVKDNTAAAVTFDATGKTGILVIKSTNAAEGVTMSGTLDVTGAFGTGATTADSLTVTNATTLNGTVGLGNAAADYVTVTGTIQGATPLAFDGATAGTNKTNLTITDPTGTNNINIPNASGTVAVSASSPLALSVLGDLTLGTTPIANGGTNSATALTASAIMVSNGTAIVQGDAGTTTTVLHGSAVGAPSYSAVSLTADVTGTLDEANGGTGAASYTVGDILNATGATTLSAIPAGAAGLVLTSNGAGTSSTYQAVSLSYPGVNASNYYQCNGNIVDGETFTIAARVYELDPSADGCGAVDECVTTGGLLTCAASVPAVAAAINEGGIAATADAVAGVIVYKSAVGVDATATTSTSVNLAWINATLVGGAAAAVKTCTGPFARTFTAAEDADEIAVVRLPFTIGAFTVEQHTATTGALVIAASSAAYTMAGSAIIFSGANVVATDLVTITACQ